MSTLDYSSEAIKLGVERLRLLGKYSDVLMHNYYGSPIDELQVGTRVINQLQAANILWRPSETSGLKLTDPVREMIVHLIADEQRRKVNADVGDFLINIRVLVGKVNEEESKGHYQRSAYFQSKLSQEVDDLNSRIATGIDSLWNRLNTDFAFVSSVQEKIYENEKAHTEVVRWLQGLELIDFNELIHFAGSNAGLRQLLVRQLQSQVSVHFSSLREVQKRLSELMARFRQQQARNVLVRGMLEFFEQKPNFQPSDYAQRSQVVDLVNQASAVLPSAAIALDRHQDKYAMQQLLTQLPARSRPAEHQPSAAPPVEWQDDATVLARRRELHEDVVSFYLQVLDQQSNHSALAYLVETQLKWDPEMWLYQVIAEYQGLSSLEKSAFRLKYDTEEAGPFNQLQIITDVELQLLSDGVLL
ncbi:hypothetical protein TOI97_08705 [Denitrificimonas sp. JX-1]|uniref:Phosphoenolpyruvate carboxylase n=1 Tax=Denitrificimonas halotolerans TaxID=3098930 RepID=A0ABU5GSH3_9GAMM|nr:hypothetical protein [Denitrificimonas sp. JX-1]MDY7219640.1 hypothetical protein [Denitrificimonas sp. JX-1]